MADEPTSGAAPAATSVTPTAQAATITSPEPQAGEGNTEILSLDEARKLRKENQTLRARQKVLDDEKAASEAAKLSEVERMTKQYADVQAQNETLAAELLEARVYQDVARHAAKLNFILPADMLAKLLLNDLDAIEFEDGKPKNIETLLQNLAKATPEIVKTAEAQQQQQKRAPVIPADNPGRSNYGPSTGGQQQQGTIRHLNDPGMWKT